MASLHQHTREQIQQRLEAHFLPTRLNVADDSHRHAKHKEAKLHPKAGHFQVVVVSEMFAGKNMVQRHRLVYECLADLMQDSIHALALETKTPQEDA